jgi:DNA polymerase V
MGAPAFEYKETFRKHNIQVFSANFPLYGDLSNRVMSILSEFTPEIEIYSIDEAFLKLEGFKYIDVLEHMKLAKRKVTKSTGIPISIGVAPSKALSKIANRIAKKYPNQTGGIYIIDSEEKRIKALKWLKIEDVWGIGRKHARRLQALGVITAYDFTQLNSAWIQKHLTIVGIRLKSELLGKPCLDLEEVKAKKNIATTRSFEHMIEDLIPLKERVSTFAVSCAEKLRKQRSCCKSLMVFVHTNGFRKDLPQHFKNIVIKLPFPTNSSIEISAYANKALEMIYRRGFSYKKAGVIIMDFIPENEVQLSLFENAHPKHLSLMKAIDTINGKFGQQKIRLAIQDQKRVWKMKQEKLSPQYTTKLSDIITIKV